MLKICEEKRTKCYMMIKNCIDKRTETGMQPKEICLNKNDSHTKFLLYRSVMNTDLSLHSIYRRGCRVPDYQRVAFTRLRLISHNLKSEKGRWSRTPANEQLCQCDRISIQDEDHALLKCTMTTDLRRKYSTRLDIRPQTTISDLMKNEDMSAICEFIYHCLKRFD